jgi:hypothetical protein
MTNGSTDSIGNAPGTDSYRLERVEENISRHRQSTMPTTALTTAFERRQAPPREVSQLRFRPQLGVQLPGYRYKRDGVPSDYDKGKQIQPIGRRVPIPKTRQAEVARAINSIENKAGRGFAFGEMEQSQAIARIRFPFVGEDNPGRLRVLAAALAHMRLSSGQLIGVSEDPGDAGLHAILDAIGNSSASPQARARAAEFLSTLRDSGKIGKQLASDIERWENVNTHAGALQAQLDPTVAEISADPGLAGLPADRQLTDGEKQAMALAIHLTCGGDADKRVGVIGRLAGYDMVGALKSERPSDPIDLATTETLNRMVLAGGSAAFAAVKAAPLRASAPMNPHDLQSAMRTIAKSLQALMGGAVDDLEKARARAESVAAAVRPRSATDLSLMGVAPRATDDPLLPPPDLERAAAPAATRGLGGAWESAAELNARGVDANDVAKRLPALALIGVLKELEGDTPSEPEMAAIGLVKSGIVDEAKLDRVEKEIQAYCRHGQAGANTWLVNRMLNNLFADDPVQPLVQYGPLGSLNNVAVPQQGMKASLGPLTALMRRIASREDPPENPRSDDQLQLEFGTVALLEHWNRQGQGKMGKQVALRPEHAEQLGLRAAALAGKTGEEAAAFAKAVEGKFGDKSLDQNCLRAIYGRAVQVGHHLDLDQVDDSDDIQAQLRTLDRAMIQATGSVRDKDQHYADEAPKFGFGAMKTGSDGRRARDGDRFGTRAEIMRNLGTSSGWNATSYKGFYMPDQGTIATTFLKAFRVSVFGGPVSPNIVFGYQGGYTQETYESMAANATGIDTSFGKGGTTTHGAAFGGGAGFYPGYSIGGHEQRLTFSADLSGNHIRTNRQLTYLRVARTPEEKGGVAGAGAGATHDDKRTAEMADAILDLGGMFNMGELHLTPSIAAKHEALSIGDATRIGDYVDTTKEFAVRGSATTGIGTLSNVDTSKNADILNKGKTLFSLPASAGLSSSLNYSWDRMMGWRTHGNVDTERRQYFRQMKSQLNVGAQFIGRPSPAFANLSWSPHALNYPTSMSYLRTRLEGSFDLGGTYWSYETEHKSHMLEEFEEHGYDYAAGMVWLDSQPKVNSDGTVVVAEMQRLRDEKLAQFVNDSGLDPSQPHDAQRIAMEATRLLEEDIHQKQEELLGMIEDRQYEPGVSYRGTAEIKPESIGKANDVEAMINLAKQAPGNAELAALAAAKDADLTGFLETPNFYIRNDVGNRMNTYRESEFNLAGLYFSGYREDARTNSDRAKT